MGRGLGEGPLPALEARTGPPALVPHQPRHPAERGQVNELDRPLVLDPHRPAAARTRRSRRSSLDLDPDRPAGFVGRAEHGHLEETDQQLTDANRVNSTRALDSGWRREPPDSQGPCLAPVIFQPAFSRPSDPKRPQTRAIHVDRPQRRRRGTRRQALNRHFRRLPATSGDNAMAESVNGALEDRAVPHARHARPGVVSNNLEIATCGSSGVYGGSFSQQFSSNATRRH